MPKIDDGFRKAIVWVIDDLVRPYADASNKPRMSPVKVKSPREYSTSSLDRFKRRFGKSVGFEYVLHPKQMRAEGERFGSVADLMADLHA